MHQVAAFGTSFHARVDALLPPNLQAGDANAEQQVLSPYFMGLST